MTTTTDTTYAQTLRRINERRHRRAHALVALKGRVVIVRRKRCQWRGDG